MCKTTTKCRECGTLCMPLMGADCPHCGGAWWEDPTPTPASACSVCGTIRNDAPEAECYFCGGEWVDILPL